MKMKLWFLILMGILPFLARPAVAAEPSDATPTAPAASLPGSSDATPTAPAASLPGFSLAEIEQRTGLKGAVDTAENVIKVSLPRTDLAVSIRGVQLAPAQGLTSWAGFTPAGGQVIVMGDLVLLEDEVNPVMSVALDNGIDVTALHNHFLGETPRLMFLHIGGRGDVARMAAGIGKVFAAIQQTADHKPPIPDPPAIAANDSTLDGSVIETIVGVPPERIGNLYKVTIGRKTAVDGQTAGKAMGVNTWATFAGSDAAAVVDGDFAVAETELQPVLRALRGAQISITAIHSHLVGESPRVLFLHYWAAGPLRTLATNIKVALDTQK